MHRVFALLCFVVVIHWLIFPYPSGLLHWHRDNLMIAPVPAKQPWWIWINTSCKFIMNDCITTTKQSTTKPCAYFLGYNVIYNVISKCGIIWGNYARILKRYSDPFRDFIIMNHNWVFLHRTQGHILPHRFIVWKTHDPTNGILMTITSTVVPHLLRFQTYNQSQR